MGSTYRACMAEPSCRIFILATLLSILVIPPSFVAGQSSDKGFNSLAPNYDYHATNFNPQTEITKENVRYLELKWVFPWPEPQGIPGIRPRVGSIAQPLILDGTVYGRTEDLRVYAIDAKTGRLRWSYQSSSSVVNAAEINRTLPVNIDYWPYLSSHAHSFAYFEGRIYAPYPNCQVFGINVKTGELEYRLQTPTCAGLEGNVGVFKGLQAVGPVFDGKRKVLIYGTGGREAVEGGRGAFRGYSLDDGKLLWTFYLMPPQDKGDPEWTLRVADKGWIQGIKASTLPREVLLNDWGVCPEQCGFGKGSIGIGWGQWAVDEETGIAYLATGNPGPLYNATYSPGPNVFAASVIALKTDTGELLWWHQISAHDFADLDCAWNTALATVNGRKMVFKQCKGAQLYALDALTGEAIWRTDYSPEVKRGTMGPQPNFDGLLDPTKVSDMHKPWASYPSTISWRNHAGGAESDVAVAYGKVYSTTYHFWLYQSILPVEPTMRNSYGRELVPVPAILPSNATVWAHDAATGKVVWKFDIDAVGIRGGTSVSGGLVWFTTSDGTIRALDADNGKLIWERYQGSVSPVQPVLGADSQGRMMAFSTIGSGGASSRGAQPTPGALLAYGLPEKLPDPQIVTKEIPIEIVKEVIKEIPKEVIKEVPKEVVRQVEGFGTLTLMAVSAAVIIGLLAGRILTRRKSA